MIPDRRVNGNVGVRADRGQAAVEFALTLPLIVVVVGLMVQLTAIAVVRLEVVAEANRVARAASMSEHPDVDGRRALGPTSPSSIDVQFDSDTVTVTVTRRIETNVAIVGRFIPDVEVRTRLTMAREPIR